MSATDACPGCGSPLLFRVATTTTVVCEYCKSIVVRGGAELEAIGKTNEILATGSVLKLGLEGKHKNRPFTLIGRVQLSHDLGGTWDEWLVAFEDGKLAWLAEHQGRFSLMTEVPAAEAPAAKSPEDAEPGKRFFTAFGELVVLERGTATLVGEEGELPDPIIVGARRPFIDFATRSGKVATLDFGMVQPGRETLQRRFFLGYELVPAQLGLDTAEISAPVMPDREGAVALTCPHCGSPVEKKLTESESLVCTACSSVLSVEENGELGFIFAQEKLRHRAWIPLGATAHLDEGFFRWARRLTNNPRPWPVGLDVEVVGHVVRSVKIDGMTYFFQEFLLHTERDGFFWLVESDAEWLFVRNLNPGLVQEGGIEVFLEGTRFLQAQRTDATTEQVTGELYFKMTAGQVSALADFKSGPRTLSREETRNELIWTECLKIDRLDVGRVFRFTPPDPPRNYESSYSSGSSDWSVSGDTGGAVLAKTALWVVIFFLWIIMQVLTDCDGGGGGGFHYGK